MKRTNKLKRMYALLIAVAACIGITIYGSCSSDEDFWGFDEEDVSTENTRAEKMDLSGFLKLPAGNPLKWTQDDYLIIQKVFIRMEAKNSIKQEGAKFVIDKDAKASDFNISEVLFDFIKDLCGDGYYVSEDYLGQSNKKKSFSRRKTRDSEHNNYHICTDNDYVGHAIAHCLNLDIDTVNNIIHGTYPDYPDERLSCSEILSALVLFNSYKSFVQQVSFWNETATPTLSCQIPGIVFTKNEALNGLFINFNNCSYSLFGYNAQKKKIKAYPLDENNCYYICDVMNSDSTLFAYYK